jgi:hypothetical protein
MDSALRLRQLFSVVVAGTVTQCAFAQTALGSVQSRGVLAGTGEPAKETFVVSPDGRRGKVSRPPSFLLQSEVLEKQERVEDVLDRHGLADDRQNREILRLLNPEKIFSNGVIAPGTKLDVFTVTGGSPQGKQASKYAFDSSNVSRLVFYTQASDAAEIRNAALKLPAKAYADPALQNVHTGAVLEIQNAAETLQARADTLSRRDFAVAQYQIEYAKRQAAMLNVSATVGKTVTKDEVMTIAASARKATLMGQRLASGQAPVTWRTVRVNVYKRGTANHVGPLQVYVLPSGALAMPNLWTKVQLEGFLNDFSFTKDASPTSQEVADFDARICVGPKNSVGGMARLITEGKLTTCRRAPISVSDGVPLELSFSAPEDVARP